jgi:TIR domain
MTGATFEQSSARMIPCPTFPCHASEDKIAVRERYALLRNDGFRPWLDELDILPGQDCNHAIRTALKDSAAILVCLSHCAVMKEGYVRREIKFVLDLADESPRAQFL